MASLSFPPLVLPPVAAPPQAAAVEAVAAALPVALLQAEIDALPLPLPATASATAPAAPQPDAAEGAAMRPDQLMMARQMSWPRPDGAALASSWRGMVRNYGAQLVTLDMQQRSGQLAAPLLLTGQLGDTSLGVLRRLDGRDNPLEAWRFTIHAGGPQAQRLRVVEGEAGQRQPAKRRRARAALLLELVLEDGTVVTVQAEPVADGIRLELCAPGARALARLRERQPKLEAAVKRAGLRVLDWAWRDTLPEGRAHLRLPSAEAATALSLPVFRAMAELALLLPARS